MIRITASLHGFVYCLFLVVCLLASDLGPGTGSVFAATVEESPEGVFRLGNAVFEHTIQAPSGGAYRSIDCTNRITGESLGLGEEEFLLLTSAGEVSSRDFKVVRSHSEIQDSHAILETELVANNWKAMIRNELHGEEPFDRRSLRIEYTGSTTGRLDRVWVASYRLQNFRKMVKTSSSASDLVAFARLGKGGILLNMDFPYTEIEIEGDRIRLGYALEDETKPGYEHTAEAINLGCYELDGFPVGTGGGTAIDFKMDQGTWSTKTQVSESAITSDSPDRGEIRAFREMYDILAPNRRGTAQLHFQSYDDMDMRREQASVMDRPETLYQEIDLAARWGFNSYMMYEDHNVFLPGRPRPCVVEEVSQYAARNGLLFGSGSPLNYGVGFFWKSEPKKWDHPEWAYLDANGKRNEQLIQCWGVPEFVDSLAQSHIAWIRKHDWTNWGLDFLIVNPCFDPNHPHPKGRAGFYKQMKGLMEYHRRLRNESNHPDQFFIFTWLGYDPWLPKIGKAADFFYMTDPANTWSLPAVNMHEQMLAGYRKMFWRLYMEQGVPGTMLQNPIFLANWRDGLIRDAATYQDHVISLFSFSPNINVQQPWRFLDSLTVKEYEEANQFFPKWFLYAKDHFETLRNLIVLSPPPAPGVLETYAHPSSSGDKCIVVLINTSFFRMERKLQIGEPIGLKNTSTAWAIRERFPADQWSLLDGRTRWDWGNDVTVSVPPKSTMLLEILPYEPVTGEQIRWYGFNPDEKGKLLSENLWSFQDEQSKTYKVALEMAKGHYVKTVSARNPEPLDAFASQEVQYREGCTHFSLQFPGNILSEPVQREIVDWVVKPGSLQEGLGQGWEKKMEGEATRFPLASIRDCSQPDKLMTDPASLKYEGGNIGKFMGTVLYNPWFWEMPLEVKLEVAEGIVSGETTSNTSLPDTTPKGPGDFPECSEYWLSTTLDKMAVQQRGMGYTPYFNEHMFIPLPFADYKNIEEIKAWINGIPALVEKMDYLMTPPFMTDFEHGTRDFLYYLDGSKNNLKTNWWDNPSNNRISLWVRWKERGAGK